MTKRTYTTSERRSYGPNRDFIGIGSYGSGSRTFSLLEIPSAPTLSAASRYLYALDILQVGHGEVVRIVGLRQALTIGMQVPVSQDPQDGHYPLYREVVSPFWYFPDGNVAWGLRVVKGRAFDNPSPATIIAPNTWPGLYPREPSLLYRTLAPYAPASAVFQGKPLADLGLFWDLSFPWQGSLDDHRIVVKGPALVIFAAQVGQTDPSSRPVLPMPQSLDGLRPEDQFVLRNPLAQYSQIGGRIIYESLTGAPKSWSKR